MSYTKIPNSEAPDDEESNLESQQHSGLDLGTSRQKRSLYVLLWLFSLACTSFSTRWYYQVLPSRDPSCSRNLPYDSTSMVHNDIKLHNDWITRNGTLWNDVTPSPFRGPPSPQVDAAWESLWMPNPILISEAEMQQHHLSTKGAVRWPKDTTGKTYIGHMDIFHLMHCLNEVRKGNWFNYYRSAALSPFLFTFA
ncbi:hypothetical protein E2P81_ATG04077 [Venturia nashicola]|nr:hypothetical protein E2P81_ATG04077 [Venturia nashicola]